MIKERSFLMYLLLTIVTCGIYSIYYWYTYTEELNRMTDGDGEPLQDYIVVLLLSIITCGIYKYIWLYKVGNKLVKNGPRYGVSFSEDGSTILLWYILGSFIAIGPFMAVYFLTNNFNTLAIRFNNPTVQQS